MDYYSCVVIDIWLNLSMGTCTDHGKGLHHLSMDKSDVEVLEEAVDENASCDITIIINLQVAVRPFERQSMVLIMPRSWV